ncbi:MAG: agmatinase family protein [Tissierellia bacterium]|nr:agmatinase family protein [Tissierellia bacterium]
MKIKHKNKFGILGMSYDTTTSKGYPGARYAPEQIRKSLQWIKNRVEEGMLFDVEADRLIDMSKFEIKDFGDTDKIIRYDNKKALDNIKSSIDKIYEEGYSPILLGGDHSTGWPGIKALHDNTKGNIGIIHVDSHLDLVKESPVQGLYSGSSQMRRASEMERINAENFVQVGMRSYNSPEHYHFIKDSKITLIPANQVFETSIEEVAKKAIEAASRGTEHIYMSVDIDVLDSAFAPGSGANEPGGFTSYQLFKFVKLVAPYIDAIDIVEVNPLMDFNNMTSIVASKLLFDYIISNYYATEDNK